VGGQKTDERCRRRDLAGQRAHELDAFGRQNLRDDDHAELDLTLRDEFRHDVGLRANDFRFHGIGNSETFEQAMNIDTAADVEIGNGLRVEQRTLQRFDRADVRFTRARADFDANA